MEILGFIFKVSPNSKSDVPGALPAEAERFNTMFVAIFSAYLDYVQSLNSI